MITHESAQNVGDSRSENSELNTPAQRSTDVPVRKFPDPSLTDELLETAINVAYTNVCKAVSPAQKREALAELCELVKQRSPLQIVRMEQERRLTPESSR